MKKIAVVTHSFHQKSKSINILVDEIFSKENFSIDYIYIDEWTTDPIGPNENIQGYDIVVVVQLISLEILSKIKCDNVIFIPMYDLSHSWDIFKWLDCLNLKILSLTKTMHIKLCALGFNSYYIKYYPEPAEFIPGDTDKLFLWQRTNKINIKTTLQLLNRFPISNIHLHKSIDPYQTFIEPSAEEIKKYNIVLSDWFADKNDYLDIIKKAGLYMAPRLLEGGAAAFIDGMKMGKVVIANNDAAMNEYIIHNETGLLYDANDIQPFDFAAIDLARIQKNAYASIKEGHAAWRKSIPDILEFIHSNAKTDVYTLYKTLTHVRTAQYSLKQDNLELTQKLQQTELIIKDSKWHNFGKLSSKEKVLKAFKVLYNVVFRRISYKT